MATFQELQLLQQLVDSVLPDGVTEGEGLEVISMAQDIGATPQRLALMSGIPEEEVRGAISAFSPNSSLLNYDVGFTNPYTRDNDASGFTEGGSDNATQTLSLIHI